MSEPGPTGTARPAASRDPVPEASPAVEDEGAAAAIEPTPTPPGGRRPRRARIRGWLHPPRSRGGIFALLLVLGGFGALLIFSGASLIHWTETADFCGRCHQMGPEIYAYETGPHRDVACAECHVKPGVVGWVEAKLNGTKQLFQVITGLYPKPVPPPDHDNLPKSEETCLRCHSLDRLATSTLVTKTLFTEDEENTRQFVGLMVRPGSGDVMDTSRSVHWHVLRRVEYWTPDENAATIDYVAVSLPDGTTREFISQDQVRISEDVSPDVDRLRAAGEARRMNCIDCHNRVGHPIPNPRTGLDRELVTGRMDPSLPYVKREGMRVLWASYPSVEAADAEIERLRQFYEVQYPLVAEQKSAEINSAINQMKVLYRLTATPEMKVTAMTYPDNLGHTDFPGCFRCHDGGHFLIEQGAVTRTAIPATCDTCHTFPQIGGAVASLPLGEPPSSHDDALYVFSHKNVATSVDPGGTTCGECHARDYCVNCHKTGAVQVEHDDMMVQHAQIIKTTGVQACAYCHQATYCARCHTQPVLPGGAPVTQAPGGPEGVRWPLFVAAGR